MHTTWLNTATFLSDAGSEDDGATTVLSGSVRIYRARCITKATEQAYPGAACLRGDSIKKTCQTTYCHSAAWIHRCRRVVCEGRCRTGQAAWRSGSK
jgi:hypothetical protein